MLTDGFKSRSGNIRHFYAYFLTVILVLTGVASAENSSKQYSGGNPCDFIDSVEFNGTAANESVLWQTSIGPRLPGSNASAQLRQSISENLSQWSFEESSHERENFTLTNLVGSYSPNNSTGQNVVFVAHYDSRYIGDRDENETLRSQPIPGANDGASGVAVLIELGRIIPSLDLQHDVTLFFTDAEDQGKPFLENTWSYGADAWVSNLTEEYKENISAYIVVDMIGDAYLDFTRVSSTSDVLWDTVTPIAAALGMIDGEVDCQGNNGLSIYNPDPGAERGVIDDHVAAHNAGIPAINFIDLNYGENASFFGGHWHTHNDTADKVSSESLQYIGSMLELGLRTDAWVWNHSEVQHQNIAQNLSENEQNNNEQSVVEEVPNEIQNYPLLTVFGGVSIAIVLFLVVFLRWQIRD
tara:strand:+ start:2081 stop:3316 length:1236 start_codon:yes stop_codon:yes gene_type:complete